MADALPVMVNADELTTAMRVCIEIRRAAMIWGPPGVGKSAGVRSLAKQMGIELRDIRALLMNPVDVNGIPHVVFTSKQVIELSALFRENPVPSLDDINAIFKKTRTRAMNQIEKLIGAEDGPDPAKIAQVLNQTSEVDLYGQTVWSRPGFLPTTGRGILFFDELTAAAVEVQAALYQCMLDFKIGEHVMASGWVPFGASNRETDKGVSNRMPAPLADRMFHFDLVVEWAPWEKWAGGEGNIHPLIIAYLQTSMRDEQDRGRRVNDELRQELTKLMSQSGLTVDMAQDTISRLKRRYSEGCGMLHRFDPKERSFPTPRSWEMVSDALRQIEDMNLEETQVEKAVVAGKVGRIAAEELLAFAITFRSGFTVNAALLNPMTCPVPSEPSMQCAVAGALARNSTTRNIDQAMKYVARLPEEYQIVYVKQATERDATLASTRPVTRFMIEKQDIMA